MTFSLTVNMDNEAFSPRPSMELQAIFREVLQRLGDGQTKCGIADSNGNRVGSWEVK